MSLKNSIKKGETLIITAGEYSGYGVVALARALHNFTYEDLNKVPKCKATLKSSRLYSNRDYQFWSFDCELAEMVKAGLVEELPYTEMNIGW